MPVPTPMPSPTMTALVDQGLPKSLVDSFAIAGTIATALGVLIALGVAVGGWLKQRRREERAQAELLYAFVQRTQPILGGATRTAIHVVNASQSPVYSVIVGAGTATGPGLRFFNGDDNCYVIFSLPPGEHVVANQGASYTEEKPPFSAWAHPGSEVTAVLTFRDSSGQWWEKDAHGLLRKIKDGMTAREITDDHVWQPVRRLNPKV